MRNVGPIVRKEFIQLRRDPRMFFILFVSPVIQLVLLGYAANLDIRNIPVVFCDFDVSRASRDFMAGFLHSGYFNLAATTDRLKDIDGYIDKGKASLAVVIPRGLERKLTGGETVRVQVIVDGSESQSAIIALNYATMVGTRFSGQVLLERIERSFPRAAIPAVDPEVRVWYNPDLKSRNFMVPGVLALLLMVATTMLTSLALVKEKEMGTMEQLIVTPVRAYELILGKFLPFLFVGLVDVNPVLLIGLSLVYMLTTLGLGLLFSTISRSQQQAQLTAVFSMIPMIVLSGFVFPIDNMPRLIQYVTYIVPMRYYLVIIRGLFLKGVGLRDLWLETLVLLAFGLVILGMSVLRFRKKLE
jgi:ABC-2 type transport system permease protein